MRASTRAVVRPVTNRLASACAREASNSRPMMSAKVDGKLEGAEWCIVWRSELSAFEQCCQ